MTYRSGEQIYMEAVKHNQGYSAKYRVTKLLGKDGCLFLAVNFVLCFWMLLDEKLLSSLKCTTGVLLLYSIRNKCGCHYIMQRPRANCIFPTNKPVCVCVCVRALYLLFLCATGLFKTPKTHTVVLDNICFITVELINLSLENNKNSPLFAENKYFCRLQFQKLWNCEVLKRPKQKTNRLSASDCSGVTICRQWEKYWKQH